MADGALLLGIVVFSGVAGETETPGRDQLGDTLRSVAGIAVLVSVDRRLVRGQDLVGRVTGGTSTIELVVLDMAAGTGEHG